MLSLPVSRAHRHRRFAPVEKTVKYWFKNKAFALFGAAKLRMKSLKHAGFSLGIIIIPQPYSFANKNRSRERKGLRQNMLFLPQLFLNVILKHQPVPM